MQCMCGPDPKFVQFLFLEGCCFLFHLQKPSPVRQEVRYMIKYNIPVHFQEKMRSSKIFRKSQYPPTTSLKIMTCVICRCTQRILISLIHFLFQSVFLNISIDFPSSTFFSTMNITFCRFWKCRSLLPEFWYLDFSD